MQGLLYSKERQEAILNMSALKHEVSGDRAPYAKLLLTH
jgi:hypothetical protein